MRFGKNPAACLDFFNVVRHDPITMTVLTVASTAVSALGAIQQGNAASKASKYNASVANQNAQIATDQANAELAQHKVDTYRKLGSIKAGYGAAGVTSSGSPMDVLADSFTQSELDAQTIIYNGKLRAAGYTNSANLDNMQAKQAKTAGYTSAAGSLLSGGSDIAGYWDGPSTLPWQTKGNVNPNGGYY